jgi:hypothetical protein
LQGRAFQRPEPSCKFPVSCSPGAGQRG